MCEKQNDKKKENLSLDKEDVGTVKQGPTFSCKHPARSVGSSEGAAWSRVDYVCTIQTSVTSKWRELDGAAAVSEILDGANRN